MSASTSAVAAPTPAASKQAPTPACTTIGTDDTTHTVNGVASPGAATFSNLLRPDLKDYCPASNLAFNEKVRALQAEGEKVYHFAFGQSPFPIMQHMVDALKEFAYKNDYLPVAGIPDLREAICALHKRYDHLDFTSDQVINAPGSKELILLLLSVFNGDVLLVSPSWTTYKPQALLSQHKVHVIQTSMETGWRITPHEVKKTIEENNLTAKNKILILCNPCNPTGTSYKEEHLRELTAIFREYGIVVISDEIYARLSYKQNHHTLATYYPEGTIISSGFSKWASAGGWRMGYHIYPAELSVLRDAVRSAASHSYSCAPAPQQFAIAKALSDLDACDLYIKHCSRIMNAVSEFCVRELRSVGVSVEPAHSGYYIFPDFEVIRPALEKRGITTGDEMCQLMFSEAKVALMSGGPAFLRDSTELTTRFCYVNFDGSQALHTSMSKGLGMPLDEQFVQQYCAPVYDGIQALKSWIQGLLDA